MSVITSSFANIGTYNVELIVDVTDDAGVKSTTFNWKLEI